MAIVDSGEKWIRVRNLYSKFILFPQYGSFHRSTQRKPRTKRNENEGSGIQSDNLLVNLSRYRGLRLWLQHFRNCSVLTLNKIWSQKGNLSLEACLCTWLWLNLKNHTEVIFDQEPNSSKVKAQYNLRLFWLTNPKLSYWNINPNYKTLLRKMENDMHLS